MKRSTLNIQTEGLSKVKTYTLEVLNHILPQLKKLEGIKIINADGSKSKKYYNVTDYERQDEKGENVYTSYQYYIEYSKYSVWLKVKICINGGSYDDNTAYCTYFNESFYIGKMDDTGTFLKEVEDIEKVKENNKNALINDYTETHLAELIQQFEEAKSKVRDLFNSIPESVKQAKFLNRSI